MVAGAACAGAQAAPPKAAAPAAHKGLLPDALDGWVAEGAAKTFADAAQADAANAAALKEYSFAGGELATYKREGETLIIRALQFDDASGAYGAYSYYRQNGWPKEDIGAGATSDHNRVLFWKGDTVVDATFSRIGAMSAGEMRELAEQIKEAPGSKALLATDIRKSAARPHTKADHALRGRACGLHGRRRCTAGGADRVRSRGRSGYGELRAQFRTGNAHHHRLPDTADGRGATAQDYRAISRLAEARSRPGPRHLSTPTLHRLRCGAAARWWRL